MKKWLLVVCLLACGLGAQAYEKGDMTLGLAAVYSALALGTDFGEINVDDPDASIAHDAKLGKNGMGAELQALYFLNPQVGVGISVADQYFAKDRASGWQLNTRTRMQHLMAVGHVFLTPQAAYKLYVPLGVGLAHTDFSMDFSPLGDSKKHFNYTGFAYYVGLGVERKIGERFSLALEGRYNGNRFHDSTTRDNGDHVTVYPRANFMSVLLRLVYKL